MICASPQRHKKKHREKSILASLKAPRSSQANQKGAESNAKGSFLLDSNCRGRDAGSLAECAGVGGKKHSI